jgi:hypothetical protein
MVSTFTRALWGAQIQEWIWGPRRPVDHARAYNLAGQAEASLPEGDPTLEVLRYYRDLAAEALVTGGPGCLPIWGGPTVYDKMRDTTPEERQETARRLRQSIQFYGNQPNF